MPPVPQRIELLTQTADFTPSVIGSDQTAPLFQLPRGGRALWVSIQKSVLAASGSTATVSVGDGSDTDRYLSSVALDTGNVGDLVDGNGTYAAWEATNMQRLYSARDTIDLTYTAGASPGATKPKVRVRVTYLREWPGI